MHYMNVNITNPYGEINFSINRSTNALNQTSKVSVMCFRFIFLKTEGMWKIEGQKYFEYKKDIKLKKIERSLESNPENILKTNGIFEC